MAISQSIRKAYAEVDDFLELLDDETRWKIPENIRKIFREEKDKEYVNMLNPNIPIKEQNLKEETLAIIALLNLEYFCEDEIEKERLRAVYEVNEETYKNTLQVEFDESGSFGGGQQLDNQIFLSKDVELVTKFNNESFFRKWISKLKKIFGL